MTLPEGWLIEDVPRHPFRFVLYYRECGCPWDDDEEQIHDEYCPSGWEGAIIAWEMPAP